MTTLKPLLARNRSWALQKCQHDPDYFEKWIDGQRPLAVDRLLRQPRARRGAHRQPARRALCPPQYRQHARSADDNVMSVLQYALHYLEVERVVLCGHYGCGGVQAALSCPLCRWRRNPRRWLAASASCAAPCITKLRRSPMGVVLRPPRRQRQFRRGALSPCP